MKHLELLRIALDMPSSGIMHRSPNIRGNVGFQEQLCTSSLVLALYERFIPALLGKVQSRSVCDVIRTESKT